MHKKEKKESIKLERTSRGRYVGSHIRAILSFDHIIFNSPNNQPRHKNNNTPTDLLFVWCIFHFLLKGCVWIDFKLIPEIIYRKIGCLVVTSNLVKLKSISSWPKMRAKTTENHFRFHFHFKWNATEKNIEERERKREREKERRDRDITGTVPSVDITGTAPIARSVRIWWFFSGFCLCFEEWMILYIRLATEKMWATSRKCVFYGIFKNTTKHQKIFFETFFERQLNTWKHFPFRKIEYFPEILLHKPNAAFVKIKIGSWHSACILLLEIWISNFEEFI